MKTSKVLVLACTAGIACIAVSCQTQSEMRVSSDTVPPKVESQIIEKGQAVTSQAFGVLSTRLGKAIADAGHTNAIQFCSVHGINLTRSVGVTNQVILRRVTHRPRNPENRADATELAVIRDFQKDLQEDQPLQPAVSAHKPDYYTFYAPIVLNLPLCLTCHGRPGMDIEPEVLTEIRQTYPDDEATGFALGELRGMWSIDFKRSDFHSEASQEAR